MWLDRVVPFWQSFVEAAGGADRILYGLGGVSSGLVDFPNGIHGGLESRGGRGFSHEFNASFQRIKQHASTRAAHMGKESPFDRVVL